LNLAGSLAGRHRALPGFGLSLGLTLAWLGLIVLLPLSALVLRPWEHGVEPIWRLLTEPRVVAALWLSFSTAFLAASVNLPFGLLIAWMLVRIEFPGRRIVDALVDLPFALPTAVAGIALTAVYAPNGWLGGPLAELGIRAAYSRTGIFIALVFIGLPFVVRTVEPILRDLEPELEEAAATLGAGRLETLARVILPPLASPLLTGFAMAFARGVGEYGSVIFIAGNLPGVTEIAPLLILIRLEQYDYAGAAAIGLVMLLLSFAILLGLAALNRALAPGARS